MKNFVLKTLVATCVAGTAIFLTPKISVAQVDKSLLTEVASSCQRDVFSSKYYQQLGHKGTVNPNDYNADSYFSDCIKSRYFYSLVLYKLPWLASTKEMLPGYPASAVVSLIAYDDSFSTSDIDCLASQDSSSEDCSDDKLSGLRNLYHGGVRGITMYPNEFELLEYSYYFANVYAYMCPSCYVAYNSYPSGRKMIGAFIEWFMKIEPSRRKELMSILGDEDTARNNRHKMKKEAERAWYEYEEMLERMAEEKKEQRRRDLFE